MFYYKNRFRELREAPQIILDCGALKSESQPTEG